MRRLVFVLSITVLMAGNALAFNEPDGFRGLPWGASDGRTDAIRRTPSPTLRPGASKRRRP
jgi:hypothetical protein